jgi:hypothetical protein
MTWRHIGDLDTRWRWVSFTPWPLYPMENIPCTHWVGGWLNPRVSLDAVKKIKSYPWQVSNPRCPACSLSLLLDKIQIILIYLNPKPCQLGKILLLLYYLEYKASFSSQALLLRRKGLSYFRFLKNKHEEGHDIRWLTANSNDIWENV